MKHYDDMTPDERNAWALEHVLGWTRAEPAPDDEDALEIWTAPDGTICYWPYMYGAIDPPLPNPATDLNDAWMVVQQCREWADQGRVAGRHFTIAWRLEPLELTPTAVTAAMHICRIAWYGLLAEQSLGLGAQP